MKTAKFFLILYCSAALTFVGCSIKLGPDPVTSFQTSNAGLVRIGEVTEIMTGTWSQLPNRIGFKNNFLGSLRKPEVASFFSGGVSSLIMDVRLTSDHEDDAARLSSLGALSMVTIGIIPLNFHSEWNVQCQVTLKNSDGEQVAIYNLNEKGTYEIWAYPLTMFSLFGAGTRGETDGRDVFKRVCDNLVDKIIKTIEKDSQPLASKSGGIGQAGSYSALQKNAII